MRIYQLLEQARKPLALAIQSELLEHVFPDDIDINITTSTGDWEFELMCTRKDKPYSSFPKILIGTAGWPYVMLCFYSRGEYANDYLEDKSFRITPNVVQDVANVYLEKGWRK